MARIWGILAAAAMALPAAAAAQDAGQIAKVRAGATSCSGCNLFQADFAYRTIAGADLSGARLRQADMTAAILDRSDFSGADLSVAEAYGGRFTGANFARANLSGASFVGAYLGYANFAGAQLDGATLAGANLEGARGLTQSQLDAACGDSTTLLPAGLRIPSCR